MPKETYRITFNSYHSAAIQGNSTNSYSVDITPLYQRLANKKCKFYVQSHIMEANITNNTIVYLNIDVGQYGSIQSNGFSTNNNNSKAIVLLDTVSDTKQLVYRDTNLTCPIISRAVPSQLQVYYTNARGARVSGTDIDQFATIQLYVEVDDNDD
jgi:hypothetical protein